MWVEVRRSGKIHRQEYERGIATSEVRLVKESWYKGIDVKDLAEDRHDQLASCPTRRSSAKSKYDADLLVQRFREYAYLTKGMWLSFVDETLGHVDLTFYFEGGIQSFVRHLNQEREVCHRGPIYVEREWTAPR